MMNAEILVVDDEAAIADLVEVYLKSEGYTVHKFYNATDALACVERQHLDLAILDVMLPDMDGFTLCQRIREGHLFPIIMLTAKVEDMDKIMGLTLGADDYITKPFLPRELTLRLGAVLRRTYGAAGEGGVIRLGAVTVDMETGVVSGNGPDRTLTAKEYALLSALNENRGRIVTVDALCMAAWRGENLGYENTLMVHMRRLREKIEPDPSHPRYLITMRGLGYRLLKEDGR